MCSNRETDTQITTYYVSICVPICKNPEQNNRAFSKIEISVLWCSIWLKLGSIKSVILREFEFSERTNISIYMDFYDDKNYVHLNIRSYLMNTLVYEVGTNTIVLRMNCWIHCCENTEIQMLAKEKTIESFKVLK